MKTFTFSRRISFEEIWSNPRIFKSRIKHLIALIYFLCFLLLGFHANATNKEITNSDPVEIKSTTPGVSTADTLFLMNTRTNPIHFIGILGEPGTPIVIINKGGLCHITGGTSANIRFSQCHYIKITGTGHASYFYGIKLSNSATGVQGLSIQNFSDNIEVDHLEITTSGFTGISAKTDDYKLNSAYSLYPNYIMWNLKLHDNYIHDLEGGEGFYVGHNAFPKGGAQNADQHEIRNVEIYNNIIENTPREGIQLGACPDGSGWIYNNIVVTAGFLYPGFTTKHPQEFQRNGIQLGQGFSGQCFSNFVYNTAASGIILLGLGKSEVFNNLIIKTSDWGFYVGNGHGQIKEGPSQAISIFNNTLIDLNKQAIKFDPQKTGTVGHFYNNLIHDATGIKDPGGNSGKFTGDPDLTKYNLWDNNISNFQFVNPSINHYRIKEGSIARNKGINIPTSPINYPLTYDYDYNERPSEGFYDVGAFEFQGSPLPSPPIAIARPDTTIITLPEDSVTLIGSDSHDPGGGNIAAYFWERISGPGNDPSMTGEDNDTVLVDGLTEGTHTIKLTVTNDKNVDAFDQVTVIVKYPSPIANAGTDTTTTTSSITLPGSGSDPAGGNVTFLWKRQSGGAFNMNGTETNDTLTLTGLTCGIYNFSLTVTNIKGVSSTDIVQVTVSPTVCPNIAPKAVIHPLDTVINLPANSVNLKGSNSNDTDGSISSYSWSKLSSPQDHNPTLSGATTATFVISNMTVAGVYEFQLVVTDNEGAKDTATTTVTINLAPPVANAGSDQILNYPSTSTMLVGTATDPDGSSSTITEFYWTQISGPSVPEMLGIYNDTLILNNLETGTYKYNLRVTDIDGLTGNDEVSVTINPDIPDTLLYRVNCGGVQVAGTPKVWGKDKQEDPSPYLDPTSGNFTTGSDQWNGLPDNDTGIPDSTLGSLRHQTSGSNPLKWKFPVNTAVSGNLVEVRLYFKVKTSPLSSDDDIGARVFHVVVEGDTVLKDYDIRKDVGLYPAKKVFIANITGDTLNIDFVRKTGNPQINAIEILGHKTNQPPTANAGPDVDLRLPSNQTYLSGSGNDPDGEIVAYAWKKVSGPATITLGDTTKAALFISDLVEGTYIFRLKVTDDLGAFGFDTAVVTIDPAFANDSLLYRVNCGGLEVADPDGVMSWELDKQYSPSVYLSATSGDYTTGTETWNAIDGSNNTGVPNKIFGTLRHQPSYANPIQYNFPTQNGTYQVKLLFKVNTAVEDEDEIGERVFHVLIEQDSVLKNYDIRSVAGVNAEDTSFTVNVQDGYLTIDVAKKVGSSRNPQINGIEIRGAASSSPALAAKYRINCGGSAIVKSPVSWERDIQGNRSQWLVYTQGGTDATTGSEVWTPSGNKVNNTGAPDSIFGGHRYQPAGGQYTAVKYKIPVANGATQVNLFFAAKNSWEGDSIGERIFNVLLEGERVLVEFDIAEEAWNENGQLTNSQLSAVKRTFYAEITDGFVDIELERGVIGNPQINGIEVLSGVTPPGSNNAPVANAGDDKTVILKNGSSIILTGSGNDSDGSIATYAWTKESGPTATLSGTSTTTLTATSLLKGKYVFRLTVTDDDAATHYDEVIVWVIDPMYRVNCGGLEITASPINWTEDRQNGVTSSYLVTTPSHNTLTTGSFQWSGTKSASLAGDTVPNNIFGGHRYDQAGGTNMRWKFPVTRGKVQVRLYFAIKSESTIDDLGERVFDIKIQNNLEAEDFDIRKEAGSNAYVLVREVVITDKDTLDIEFISVTGNPQVNAIQILAMGTAPAARRADPSFYEEEFSQMQFNVYPNPFTHKANIEVSAPVADVVTIDVYDMKGVIIEQIYKGTIEANTVRSFEFNGSRLASGIYICRFVTSSGVHYNKLVIQK